MLTVEEIREHGIALGEGGQRGEAEWLTAAQVCERLDRVCELLERRVADGVEALAECRAMAERSEATTEEDAERFAGAGGRAVARALDGCETDESVPDGDPGETFVLRADLDVAFVARGDLDAMRAERDELRDLARRLWRWAEPQAVWSVTFAEDARRLLGSPAPLPEADENVAAGPPIDGSSAADRFRGAPEPGVAAAPPRRRLTDRLVWEGRVAMLRRRVKNLLSELRAKDLASEARSVSEEDAARRLQRVIGERDELEVEARFLGAQGDKIISLARRLWRWVHSAPRSMSGFEAREADEAEARDLLGGPAAPFENGGNG